ncbi:hsp70/Hsp90 co-chaperone CNS1 [Hirsutella rhossiliensis]|uniref:Hsp70/Hsp90 co-chaperone CNS1 n=1 Tax=Hirsutella rhossiliensis TaxID=111463 RepID=A0A9P8SLY6_9HYPO|nr:hsp70/Hsp90 co-chaperone CNS1 [Hirsutella rhossiliensis]KAH0965631.1 hsp70/Hsp90 co-chaperone CNS1 [Hirsutella rhossiliensis]
MHVDQLTEEMERAMSVSKPAGKAGGPPSPSSSQSVTSDSTKPALPPSMAAAKEDKGSKGSKTVDEAWAELNKSPLFMTELEENDDIAALQALSYEGTALENAADFKERGNECFKVRGYVDAKEFYAKGIAILAAEERKRARGEPTTDPAGEPDSEEEVGRQREMLEALYVNRAACHLALDNFRSCWLDGAAALRLNPRNVKACYRSARALLAVDRIAEADDVCARGLALEPDNAALTAVAADIVARARELDARRRREAERAARDARRAKLLAAALAARNIPTRSTGQAPSDMGDTRLALVPDPDDPRSTLSFPALLLYPLRLESDLVQAFNETHSLDDHLAYMLPPPWDQGGDGGGGGGGGSGGEYATPDAVSCYLETRTGGLLKMGKRVPLLKVLATGKIDVVDEVLRIFVVPVAKADGWVAKFKAQRAAEKGAASASTS